MLLCYHVREKEEESIAVYAMATSVITLLLTTCESHVFEGKESILGAATWRGAVNETELSSLFSLLLSSLYYPHKRTCEYRDRVSFVKPALHSQVGCATLAQVLTWKIPLFSLPSLICIISTFGIKCVTIRVLILYLVYSFMYCTGMYDLEVVVRVYRSAAALYSPPCYLVPTK